MFGGEFVYLLHNSIMSPIVSSVVEGHRTVIEHMQQCLAAGTERAIWCGQLLPQVKVGIVGKGV